MTVWAVITLFLLVRLIKKREKEILPRFTNALCTSGGGTEKMRTICMFTTKVKDTLEQKYLYEKTNIFCKKNSCIFLNRGWNGPAHRRIDRINWSYDKTKVKEEVDNETFTKELKDQKAKFDGKKKGGDVAKPSVQAVKQEEVEQIDEVAPPGREKQVKALKKVPGIDNPWAVSWASYRKSHPKKKD